MNKVVVKINFFNKLFNIAKLNRKHEMTLQDRMKITMVFSDLSKRIQDVNEQAVEKVSKVLEEL